MAHKIDLQYAMHVAAGEIKAANPIEEAQVLYTLLDAHNFAAHMQEKVNGFTSWQILDAFKDYVQVPTNSPAFKEHVKNIGEFLSGKNVPNADKSPFLASLTHWDKLSAGQRMDVCHKFVGYMHDLFNEEFSLSKKFRLSVKAFREGPAHEAHDNTGAERPVTTPVSIRTHATDPSHFTLLVNRHNTSTFNEAATTMRGLFAIGIKVFNHFLAETHKAHDGQLTPPDVKEDAERTMLFDRYRIPQYTSALGTNLIYIHRDAEELAKLMENDLVTMIETKGRDLPLPPDERSIFARVLGL